MWTLIFLKKLACVQSYGEHCQHPCSFHCYNKTCDIFNGRCLLGCKDGFYGGMCDRGNSYPCYSSWFFFKPMYYIIL